MYDHTSPFIPGRNICELLSWTLMTELHRRHAGRNMKIIEYHPGGGQYDCLALTLNGDVLCSINRHGSFHIHATAGRVKSGRDVGDWIWERLLGDDDPALLLDEISDAIGLPRVPHVPPSTPQVLAHRCIVGVLAATITQRARWRVMSGYMDSSGYEGCDVRTELFEKFPTAQARLVIRLDDDLLRKPAYRFWFLVRNDEPLVCIETTGSATFPSGSDIDLPTIYKKRHDVHDLVFSMIDRITV